VHPETKGKVENPFRTVERRFLHDGEWRDWADFEASMLAFEQDWETRIHPSTAASPQQSFEEEREALVALSPKAFLGCQNQLRHVQNDGLFSWDGVRYCVPIEHGLRQVRIRTEQGRTLVVYSMGGEEVIRHELRPPGSRPVIDSKCYEAHEKRKRASIKGLTAHFRERYAAACPVAEEYLLLLLKHHENNPDTALARVIELLTNVPLEVACSVFGDLVTYRLPGFDALKSILATQMQGSAMVTPPPLQTSVALPSLDVERPLSAYAMPDTELRTRKEDQN
jgi:hypothetical protein